MANSTPTSSRVVALCSFLRGRPRSSFCAAFVILQIPAPLLFESPMLGASSEIYRLSVLGLYLRSVVKQNKQLLAGLAWRKATQMEEN